ncbi:MAG: hypothetical protein P8047_18040 [Gammaproteobacteria bacterium]
MNTSTRHLIGITMLALLLAAHIPAQAGEPEGKSQSPHTSGTVAQNQYLYGKVVKTMDSGGYTYVQLDTGKQKVWAAGPVTPVKKGDAVRISTGMPMPNFHSNTLKRDFKLVYFSTELKVADNNAMQASNKSMLMRMMSNNHPDSLHLMPRTQPHPAATTTQGDIPLGKIKKAKNGKTIAEILSTKQDLLVITGEKVAKNAGLLLVEGTVVLDKDNGIGHIYPAVLDKAKILKN